MADPAEVGEWSATGLRDRMAGPGSDVVLLDVREDHERDHARIAAPTEVGDLHIPLGQLATRAAEVEEAARGRTLVVYCHHGQRSMVAATWLARRGVGPVANLDGGIDAWSIRVDPSVRRY